MKQTLFSRNFPATHPRKGQPTYFPEKILSGLAEMDIDFSEGFEAKGDMQLDFHEYYNADPKYHTIRAGKRWKVGDMFAPKVWSGKPYRSKCIQFAPAIEIVKVWDIVINKLGHVSINNKVIEDMAVMLELAKNDGLSVKDMGYWFYPSVQKEDFEGQIICWNENIKY